MKKKYGEGIYDKKIAKIIFEWYCKNDESIEDLYKKANSKLICDLHIAKTFDDFRKFAKQIIQSV